VTHQLLNWLKLSEEMYLSRSDFVKRIPYNIIIMFDVFSAFCGKCHAFLNSSDLIGKPYKNIIRMDTESSDQKS